MRTEDLPSQNHPIPPMPSFRPLDEDDLIEPRAPSTATGFEARDEPNRSVDAQVCARCGADDLASARFCRQCGAGLGRDEAPLALAQPEARAGRGRIGAAAFGVCVGAVLVMAGAVTVRVLDVRPPAAPAVAPAPPTGKPLAALPREAAPSPAPVEAASTQAAPLAAVAVTSPPPVEEAGPSRAKAGRAKPGDPIEDPDWIRRPTPKDVYEYYPVQAERLRLPGEATMDCTVASSGRLTHCRIVEESPEGLGFGQSTLEIARLLQVRATTQSGESAVGRPVRVPVTWRIAENR